MQQLKYIVYQEGQYYVSQCLNIDVCSFGDSIDDAIANLKEAVELSLEDEYGQANYHNVGNTLLGEMIVNA